MKHFSIITEYIFKKNIFFFMQNKTRYLNKEIEKHITQQKLNFSNPFSYLINACKFCCAAQYMIHGVYAHHVIQ